MKETRALNEEEVVRVLAEVPSDIGCSSSCSLRPGYGSGSLGADKG